MAIEYYRRGERGVSDTKDTIALQHVDIHDGRLAAVHIGTYALSSTFDRPAIFFNGARYEPVADADGKE